MTTGTLLLLGMDAAIASEPVRGTGFGRQTWLIKVLAEQLIEALPTGSTAKSAACKLWDEQRGVTNRAVMQVADHLLKARFIEPVGVGRDAVWTVSQDRRDEVARLRLALSSSERAAIDAAAHRTLAMSEAWSNTFRA